MQLNSTFLKSYKKARVCFKGHSNTSDGRAKVHALILMFIILPGILTDSLHISQRAISASLIVINLNLHTIYISYMKVIFYLIFDIIYSITNK